MDKKTPQTGKNPLSQTITASQFLVVLSQTAPASGRIYKLNKDRLVIGSVVSADVQVQGEGVAPIHAVIEIQTDGSGSPVATIFDLASDTGVFVNGVKHLTARLKTGDEITVGRFALRFSIEDPNATRSVNERVSQTGSGQKLYYQDAETRSLMTEDERGVEEIFDYRPTSKQALEVVMSWSDTILDVEHYVDQNQVTIGSERENDFGIPPTLQSGSKFPIATRSGDAYSLGIDPSMKGVVQRAGQVLTLDQIRAVTGSSTLTLGQNEFAKISVGDVDFYFSYTAAPPRLKSRRILDRDPYMFRILVTSMGLSLGLLATMFSVDLPQEIEVEQLPERLATILYQPTAQIMPKPKVESPKTEEAPVKKEPEPKKTVKVEVQPSKTKPKEIPKTMSTKLDDKTVAPQNGGKAQKADSEAKEGAGAKAKGEAGQRGSKNAAPGKTPQELAKRTSPQGGTGRGGGNSQVQDQGNVDLLKGAATAVQNILGNTAAKLGTGGSELKGFGNFSTLGKGGQALSGSGKGGGGDAEGLGGLADKGRGGGRVGTGLGAAGNGNGIIGGRSRVVLRTGGEGETVVSGSMDRGAIAAAIEAHRDEFRLCYEREINAETPNLAGTVKTSFVIGASGRVTEAGVESSSIRNSNVEGCVIRVLKRIDFPQPVGGGVVQVSYPFKYSSAK